ncbi:lipocalin family protein [Neptunitalea lumnitzerae]|nr:lipocalin family protein [Neptunitalea sp. Y10]
MKKHILVLVSITAFIYACTESDDTGTSTNGFVGTWKLKATMVSPGGPVPFEPIESDKQIILNSDLTFTSNGEFCSMVSTETGSTTTGTYSTMDSLLMQDNCNMNVISYPTLKLEADTLIVSYLCIEDCAEKYIRR